MIETRVLPGPPFRTPGKITMPLTSIWDYLRDRTKSAVLAGFQDALDVVEQDDQGSSEYQAAQRLRERLSNAPVAVDHRAIPHVASTSPGQGRPQHDAGTGTSSDDVDDGFAARLNAPLTPPSPNGPSHPYRRKRGRPRKDEVR